MKRIFTFILLIGFFGFYANAQNSFTTDPNADGTVYVNSVEGNKVLTMITHSTSQNIIPGSISCNNEEGHADNSYFRVFDLATDFSITAEWQIESVDVGVESATSGTGTTQPVFVKLYTLDGAFVLANLTEIGSEEFVIDNADEGTVVNLVLTEPVVVPANSILVYEFFTPNGQTDGNFFFIGSNDEGQTDLSYLLADDCGAVEPTDIGALGFPDMHIVMNVWGNLFGIETVTFHVFDETGDIQDAVITVSDGSTVTTDVDGLGSLDLVYGDYTYSVVVNNYFEIIDQDLTVPVGEVVEVEMTLTGVDELDASFKVFPNPTSGIININIDGKYSLRVMDMTGRVVTTQTMVNKTNIDLSGQEQGVYFLQLTSRNNTINYKVVVE